MQQKQNRTRLFHTVIIEDINVVTGTASKPVRKPLVRVMGFVSTQERKCQGSHALFEARCLCCIQTSRLLCQRLNMCGFVCFSLSSAINYGVLWSNLSKYLPLKKATQKMGAQAFMNFRRKAFRMRRSSKSVSVLGISADT